MSWIFPVLCWFITCSFNWHKRTSRAKPNTTSFHIFLNKNCMSIHPSFRIIREFTHLFIRSFVRILIGSSCKEVCIKLMLDKECLKKISLLKKNLKYFTSILMNAHFRIDNFHAQSRHHFRHQQWFWQEKKDANHLNFSIHCNALRRIWKWEEPFLRLQSTLKNE